jgi:hypothetical protein
MKDTYSRVTTTKVIGYLTKNDEDKYIVEVYDKKDEPPTVVLVDELLEEMEGMQVSLISEQVN